jgi:hypothetical protein
MTISALLLFIQLAVPAPTPVAAPTLGYTLTGQQVYAISGLPGAAAAVPYSGLPPIKFLVSASLAPAVIALPAAADAPPILVNPTHHIALSVEGIVSMAALSPSAKYAALLTSTGLYRLPLTGDFSPQPVSLPFPAHARLALTVSDLGAVLVTTPTDLYYWSDPKTQPLHLALALRSPRFKPCSNLLAALSADPALILMDPATGLTIQTLASESDGLTSPTAMEFGSDNSLWVTQGPAAPLLHIPLGNRAAEPLPLSVPGFSALSAGVFLVDAQHILDTTRVVPSILLLPTVSEKK